MNDTPLEWVPPPLVTDKVEPHKSMWEILVPCRPTMQEGHLDKQWDNKVTDIAGGLTIMKPTIGYWTYPDSKVVREPMIPVRIYCTEEAIQKIAKMTKVHYVQDAVLYFKLSSEVYMVL